MLVSSIGYLDYSKNAKAMPVKNKNSKDNSGFGQVQSQPLSITSNSNFIKHIANSIVSAFSNKNNDKNNSNLSLMA